MVSDRKTVLKQFDYLHCDDFAAYLTDMAAKGWHFKEWKIGLVFEKGTPEKVRYAVEVFIDGSEYDLRPDVHTQEFAEYCEAAGWKLVDAKHKFVIFRQIRDDAVEILTPHERLENIAKEEKTRIVREMATSYIWLILFLTRFTGFYYIRYILSNLDLLLFAFWILSAVCDTARFLHYRIWRKTSARTIENGGAVYFGTTRGFFHYLNYSSGWYSWISRSIGFIGIVGMIVFKQYDILLFVLILIAVLAITSYLLEWFRPKEGIYHTLQAVVVIGMVFLAGYFIVTFSNEIMRVEAREVPLYYEDIGGEAGEIIEERIDGTSSIFGSTMRCSIQYADEYVYYEVYQSEYAWVLDAVWEDEMDNKNMQNAERVTEFWGADEAVHTAGGSCLVKYPDAVLILHFPTDTVLSPESVEIIQAALLESR